MRNLIYAIFLACFATNVSTGQSVTFQSQADIDGFDQGMTMINGDLSIRGTDVSDLSPLANITTVNGHVVIYMCGELENLNGLHGITTINQNLRIEANAKLDKLTGLANLDFLGGSLLVLQNPSLTSIAGLTSLNTINGGIEINTCEILMSLSGFPTMVTVLEQDLIIDGNEILKDISALQNLTKVGRDLDVSVNENLQTLEGLSGIIEVGENLFVFANNSLESISGFTNLKTVGGEVAISSNPKLKSLEGLNQLKAIDIGLIIDNNESLKSLNGLRSVEVVGTYLEISRNDSLGSINGLKGLKEVIDGDLSVHDNEALRNLDGFDSLLSINGGLSISNNVNLENLDGFSKVTLVSGELYIAENHKIQNLLGLSNVSGTVDQLAIINNSSLKNIDGLSKISTVFGSLEIIDNDSMLTIDGLQEINFVGGDMSIWNNELIESIDGLSKLNSVGWGLSIIENPRLRNLNGLSNVNKTGDLEVLRNQKLTNCCGIQELLSKPDAIMNAIEIEDNPFTCNSIAAIFNTRCPNTRYARGEIGYDAELDGCDTVDNRMQNVRFNVFKEQTKKTFGSIDEGLYLIPVQEDGQYTIVPNVELRYFSIQPDTLILSLPEDTLNLENNFCITPEGVFDDLEVSLVPLTQARPGFLAEYKMIVKNHGTTTQDGFVTVVHNYQNALTLESATPEVDDFIGGTGYRWNYTELEPLEHREIYFNIRLNQPGQIPPLTSGELLCYTAIAYPIDVDETPEDNLSLLKQLTVNSFDPNDKTCLDGNILSPDLVGNYVNYMIRFENTGTASAVNIKVTDTIDSRIFDVQTIEIIDASHSVESHIQGDVVEFFFSEIELSHIDSINDGYVVFQIKTKDDLLVGDSLTNFADIYFDFNLPIRTNIATTDIKYVSTTNVEKTSQTLFLYPNPVENALYLDMDENYTYSITNSQGKVCQQSKMNLGDEQSGIETTKLINGLYFIHVISEDGSMAMGRFLKMK